MTNAIVKQETMLPIEASADDLAYIMADFDPSDILIPRILLAQSMSKSVKNVGARPGDLLNSVELSKLGDESVPVEFIPITKFKTWTRFFCPRGAKKFEFQDILPMDMGNLSKADLGKQMGEMRGVEMLEGGDKMRWDATLNFYVILTAEFKAGRFIPYMLSCRMTSYYAGKQIVGHFTDLARMKKMPFAKTLVLKSKPSQNKAGDEFSVFSVSSAGRPTTQDEYTEAKLWFDRIRTSSLKVDNSDLEKDTTVDPSTEDDAF